MRRLLLCLALSGCADATNRYPSLLPRPIEKTATSEPPAPAPTPVAADPALDTRIAQVAREAAALGEAFRNAADEAEAKVAVARGTAEGGSAWLDAQVALGALDAARAPITAQESDLERLALDRATSGQPPYLALEQALAESRARSEQARRRSATLEAALTAR